jgi:hypothetical protein
MPVRSSSSSVLRWPSAVEVGDALEAWARAEAAARPELLRLGYFGSFARQEAGVGSDLDLVVIVSRSPRPFLERPRDWPTERLPVPAEILVYTTEEWDRLQHDGGRFAHTLATETNWVIDRPA